MTTQQLLDTLDTDIRQDAERMGRWRKIHRVIATAVTLILIVLPVATAMKLFGGGSIQTACLFALTVLAAFDGMFKPAAYSARRRVDAADMTELLWQFRSAVAALPPNDQTRAIAVHDAFRKRYQDLYRQRGQYLVDYGLAQREADKGTRSEGGSATVTVGAPAAGGAATAGATAGGAGATTAPAATAPVAGTAPAGTAPAAGTTPTATAAGTTPPPTSAAAKPGTPSNGDLLT
jgi:hypothetical protein